MINDILLQLASDNSRKFKEAVLTQHHDSSLLKDTIVLALDPFVQFYIRKIPVYSSLDIPELTLEEALGQLQQLSSRSITGNAAIEFLRGVLSSVSSSDALVIEKVIAKDLRCGVSEATVNKIWPGLIHDYPCMLASANDQKLIDKIAYPAFVQLKLDGMRFNAIVKDGIVEFRTRNGKEININSPAFNRPFMKMGEGVYDGELLVVDTAGKPLDRKTGNGILNKAVKGTQSEAEGTMVRAVLWDYIPLADFQKEVYNVPYRDRLHTLYKAVTDVQLVSVVQTDSVNDIHAVQQLFEKYLEDGQEGIILKSQDMIWENKRSKKQVKFKNELECDLVCTGWEEGTGKNVGRLGALVLESGDGLVRVGVGTGFSDADRDSITDKDIGRIVCVKYNARINDKRSTVSSLFLPVFVEFRDDKQEADTIDLIK